MTQSPHNIFDTTLLPKINENFQKITDIALKLSIEACIVAVCIDPFFLYIPFLNDTKKCLGINKNLWKVTTVLRTVADSVYYQFGFSSVVVIVQASNKKSFVNINFIFWICVFWLALAPIPQILFSEKFILKTLRGYIFWNLILFCHYGTRLLLIFRSCEQRRKRVSVKKFVRFNAVVFLILYLTVSHVIGASWYYLSIKRQVSCWNHACKFDTGCVHSFFHCDDTTTSTLNSTLVNEFCPINSPNAAVFNYGIYLDALQSGIIEEKGLQKKFLLCFFWGLRNLSSFASNLQTSTNRGETFFAIIISVLALILLIFIIGNIQRYAELASARSERIEEKMELIIKPKIKLLRERHIRKIDTETWILEHIREALTNDNDIINLERALKESLFARETITESFREDLCFLEKCVLINRKPDIQGKAEKWLSDNFPRDQNDNIPCDQNDTILFYLRCGLENDQDVNLKSVLSLLPDERKRITKKHLCYNTLKKVPGLKNIDEEWFSSMSSKLMPVIYPKESYIFREGEPLDFIIFITNGIAWSYTTSSNAGGRVSNSLERGDFFGEELVQWKLGKRRELGLDRIPLSCIPFSTANVKSHTQVEALVLMTEDLALCSDFPVATSKLWRIIRKRMTVNAFIRKLRNADSATEGVDSSSRTKEGGSVQREINEV